MKLLCGTAGFYIQNFLITNTISIPKIGHILENNGEILYKGNNEIKL